jgi:anti-sigma B factor antagonist
MPYHSPHSDDLKLDMEHHGQAVLVRMKGSGNMEVTEDLQERLYKLIDEGAERVVLDLSELNFICSTGLGGLIAAQLHARKQESELCLVNPQKQIKELLKLTKLNNLFTIYDSVDDALAGK